MLHPVDCGALPSVAWPDRGLSSLTTTPQPSAWTRMKCLDHLFMMDGFPPRMQVSYRAPPAPPSKNAKNSKSQEHSLPHDPREWSRKDVAKWVETIMSTHQLPIVHPDCFPTNGKGLCLIKIDGFVSRVPLGGKLLYKDFQLRLSKTLHS